MTGVEEFEDMWTSDLSRYGLVELEDGNCVLFDLEAWAPVVVEAEDGVLKELIARLRSAGARRLRREDVVPREE